jgi:hypothetical protein
MATYQSIVFIQGEEAEEPLELLDRDGTDAAVGYLAEWDNGDSDAPQKAVSSAGTSDRQARVGAYLLTWNARIGYIGLERVTD